MRSCFPDSGSLSAFAIFDPQKLPAETDLATYGDAELEILCEHYGTAKETENGRELQPVIHSEETKDEWVVFKQFISQNFQSCTIQTLFKRVYQSETVLCQYPNVYKLITLALTMPVSTVDCERGFSKHNLIKTGMRARLQTENVSTLIKMSINTPELSHMDDFNFARAFEIWCSVKDHVITHK